VRRFRLRTALGFAAWLLLAGAAQAFAEDGANSPEREARWAILEANLFEGQKPQLDQTRLSIEAQPRADDAALVPVAISFSGKEQVKELYFVIDDNPSPVAAHFTFGPAADPRTIRLRVRVNDYTLMHAVARLGDGSLIETVRFIKAAGGCSAPIGVSDEEARQGMGEMRVKFANAGAPGEPLETTLMMRHPNFNGMQMNQVTRLYTPARYVERIEVTAGKELVFSLATGISLAKDPVITFGVSRKAPGPLTVTGEDSEHGLWRQAFDLPAAMD
jgi:sulfur-oxidizing protein SoxY